MKNAVVSLVLFLLPVVPFAYMFHMWWWHYTPEMSAALLTYLPAIPFGWVALFFIKRVVHKARKGPRHGVSA